MQDGRRVLDADLDPHQIRRRVRHALARAPRSVVVRVTVFDPDLELGHPGANAEPHLLVTIRPAMLTPFPPLRVQSAVYLRESPAIKHVGLFGSLCRRRIAQRNGLDDVLFTGRTTTRPVTLSQLAGSAFHPQRAMHALCRHQPGAVVAGNIAVSRGVGCFSWADLAHCHGAALPDLAAAHAVRLRFTPRIDLGTRRP